MKKNNPSFLGVEGLDKLEYAEMEVHLANIHTFTIPKPSNRLYSDIEKKLYGIKMEIEQDESSVNFGKIMLFGFCTYNPVTGKNGYHYIYREDEKEGDNGLMMIKMLKNIVKDSSLHNKVICHFSEFESLHIIKLLMDYKGVSQDEEVKIAQRHEKSISGKFSKKEEKWIVPPLISVELDDGDTIGVSKSLNGNLELFVTKGNRINKCNTFKSKIFWQKTPKECAMNAGLKYANEIKEERVNWDLFKEGYNKDADKQNYKTQNHCYVQKVLRRNMYNAFLSKDLIHVVSRMFKDNFGSYPTSFYSAGTLAEAVIAKVLTKEEIKSFSIDSTIENWQRNHINLNDIAKTINISFDANSGAIIEHEKVGYVPYGANTDISSSYPAIMRYCIPDLRGSKIKCLQDIKDFNDVPKSSLNKIVMLTCEFDIPEHVRHTIMIKEGSRDGTKHQMRRNVLGHGNFIATVHYKEIEFLLSQLSEEQKKEAIKEIIEVVVIETTGKLHPIHKVIDRLWELRLKLKMEGNPAEYLVKLIMNSIYGKFFQAFQQYIYEENEDGEQEIFYTGFDAGCFFNPIVSSMITAFGRIRVQEGALNIEKNGGNVISILTDCVKFETPDLNRSTYDYMDSCFDSVLSEYEMLNTNGWSPKGYKVLGIFEEPERFTEGLFLSTAVYEYKLDNEKWEVKTSGYQTFDREFENESYLMKKIEYFIQKPESHFFKFGSKAGDYGLKLGKEEIIGFYHIVEDLEDFKKIGIKRWREIPLIFDEFSLLPKRIYKRALNDGIELSLTSVKDRLFQTSSVDIDFQYGGYGDNFKWLSFDNRKKTARELLIIYDIFDIEKEKKTKRLQEQRKTMKNKRTILSALQKQIVENIDLFPFDKFTMKEGSNNGDNARDYGIDKMRDLLKRVNLSPNA